jgi:hypothetical protein
MKDHAMGDCRLRLGGNVVSQTWHRSPVLRDTVKAESH